MVFHCSLKLKEIIEVVAKNEIKELNKIVYGQGDSLNKNVFPV